MKSITAQAPATRNGLKIREYVGYALGDTASNFFFQTFNIFLTYYQNFKNCSTCTHIPSSSCSTPLMIQLWV